MGDPNHIPRKQAWVVQTIVNHIKQQKKKIKLVLMQNLKTYPLDPFPSNRAFRSTCSLLSCLVHKLSTYISIFKHFIIQPHNGKPLAESSIILEYIDQTWNHAPRFPPEDSYKRAQIQFWAGFIQQQVKPLVI